MHNQVGYASSEIHDSTQRKEIFPPTKTYCSFNKDFARLLILMQCINKLYLWLFWGNLMTVLRQSYDCPSACEVTMTHTNKVDGTQTQQYSAYFLGTHCICEILQRRLSFRLSFWVHHHVTVKCTYLVHSHIVKFSQLISRSGTRRWNLRVPDSPMSCSDTN